MNKMLGQPDSAPKDIPTNGFVFTPDEIGSEYGRQRQLVEAKIAEEWHYDRNKIRQVLAASAASGRHP